MELNNKLSPKYGYDGFIQCIILKYCLLLFILLLLINNENIMKYEFSPTKQSKLFKISKEIGYCCIEKGVVFTSFQFF